MTTTKRVVEEVSGWLRLFDDGTVDRTWTGPPDVTFLMEPVPSHDHFMHGVATRDVTIDPNTGLSVRIYIPEESESSLNKLPLVLHFHGGGFCISRPEWLMYYDFYSRLVRFARIVCVSVHLRLAPEHRLPAACDDGFSALLWLRGVARAGGEPWLEKLADFKRVFLVGDSTGGNIVHQVAARAGTSDIEPVRVAGAVAIHPRFIRAEPSKSFLEMEESPMLTRDMVTKFMSLALPIGSTMDHPITNPIGAEAPPLEGLKLPPMMVAVAEKDLLRDTELEYCERMKVAGKEVEVVVNKGIGHSFYLNKLAVDFDPHTAVQTEKLIDAIKNFISMH